MDPPPGSQQVAPRIVAHRGYSAVAPENTLAAVQAALDAGADGIEWDLQIAACGTPVLFHDDTLDRTTDASGPVAHRTAEELSTLDAGGWFGEAFSGEPVPTFQEALARVGPASVRLFPEVKGPARVEGLDALIQPVLRAGAEDRTTFISAEWDMLEALGDRSPALRLGYVVDRPERMAEAAERALARPGSLLDPDYRILLSDPNLVREVRSLGLPLATWTVNDPNEAERLVELGVSWLTTDEVDRLRDWRDGRPR